MKLKFTLVTMTVLALTAGADAQLSAVGPFAGSLSDDFESYADYNQIGTIGYDSLAIMGGGATLFSNPGGSNQNWIWDEFTATWGLGASGPALTHSPQQAMGLYNGSSTVSTGIKFATAVSRWGTWYASDNQLSTSIAFFDAGGVQIDATQSASSVDNNMVWIGWSSTVAIKSIIFGGSAIAPVMDDMQADVVPEPATLAIFSGLVAIAARRRRK